MHVAIAQAAPLRQEILSGDVADGVGIGPHEHNVLRAGVNLWVVAGVYHDKRDVQHRQPAERRAGFGRMLRMCVYHAVDVPCREAIDVLGQTLGHDALYPHIPPDPVRMEISHQSVELSLSAWTRQIHRHGHALAAIWFHGCVL